MQAFVIHGRLRNIIQHIHHNQRQRDNFVISVRSATDEILVVVPKQ